MIPSCDARCAPAEPLVTRRPAAETSGAQEASEGILRLPGEFRLHHGGSLRDVEVAWRLEGARGAPVVVALGGISAHRRVFCVEDRRAGWWSELAGPGLPLDAGSYRLLGYDFLGGSGQSTAPVRGAAAFPPVSSFDQADLLRVLCDGLGIGRLHAIAGASYGGMVALAFGQRYPDRVNRLLVISASHTANPLATAWRSVERECVRFGLARGDGPGGLRLARALAMATYRTRAEFDQRFSREARRVDDRMLFPVEEYLFARGDAYAGRYAPESFLCLSESIDLHRVDPERIAVPATLVGITGDQLVTIEEMRELECRLAGPARLYELDSLFGHDAFLKERERLAPIFREGLEGGAS
jgi:homoserine O-acetyltransferase